MKKITLMVAIFAATFSMKAQEDCANAEEITVGMDATVTVNSDGVTGTAPEEICNGYNYTSADISAGAWYSYTNDSGQDLIVTVSVPDPTAETDYFPSFNIASGSCEDLTCVGGNIITQTASAEDSFLATAGTTYYIIFDDLYANQAQPAGTTGAFSFDVTTNSDVPDLPGVASNPTPEDGATDVVIGETGNGETSVDFAWDVPTTGGPAESYIIAISTDNTFPQESTISGNFDTNQVDGLYLPNEQYFQPNTTYYWQVIPMNAAGTTEGDVATWSFTTAALGVNDFKANVFNHYISNETLEINAQNTISEVKVFNLLGQQVATQKGNDTQAQVNLSDLTAGVYLAQVQVEGKVQTFKFIKK